MRWRCGCGSSASSTISYAWYWFVLAFVIDDLAYYAFHRSAHRVRWFWASHVIHHSSQHYNLSTALRQTWTGFVSGTWLPVPAAAVPDRLPAGDGLLRRGAQPRLPVLDPHRGDRPDAALVRGGDEHAVAPPRPPRDQSALSRRNYAGVFIVWDRMFGTFEPERDDDRPRYGIVKNLGSFNLLWAAFHEWIGIAKDVWAAPNWKARWVHDRAAGLEPRRQPRHVGNDKARWEAREQAGVAWKKPTSSSSAEDRAGAPSRAA
jgi:hypothetical protein